MIVRCGVSLSVTFAVLLFDTQMAVNECAAELKPDEIAIIAVRTSWQSRELAHYYARTRGIPESHICLIDVPGQRNLPRDGWEQNVRPGIRRWIAEHNLQARLRCFVTTWDVPLKIGRSPRKGTND